MTVDAIWTRSQLHDLLLPGLRGCIGDAIRWRGRFAYDDWDLIEERCRQRLWRWVNNLPEGYKAVATATMRRMVAEEMQP